MNAFAVLSDSGTLSEESALLGFPAVLIRTSTERPEVLDKGMIDLGGITEKGILQAVEVCSKMRDIGKHSGLAPDYIDLNVSLKIIRIIQSYAQIIDSVIWRK
jgi:UDP-N-acetylglucosamine 2-epimerase (non-hydrolysing)